MWNDLPEEVGMKPTQVSASGFWNAQKLLSKG